MRNIKAFAPATIANFNVGYDILGLSLNNIGDEVELWIIFIGSGETLDILGGTQSSYLKMYQGGGTSIGGNAKIDNIFSKKDSVLDFLNGIIQKFNLVIEYNVYLK